MSQIGKDQILAELINFFLDEYNQDPIGVTDWLIQGRYNSDEFYDAVVKLQDTMKKLGVGNND